MDSGEALRLAKTKSEADFPILSDSKGSVVDQFGLRHKGGNAFDGTDIARPAVIVLDRSGKVIHSDYTDNYRVRPSAKKTADKLIALLKGE